MTGLVDPKVEDIIKEIFKQKFNTNKKLKIVYGTSMKILIGSEVSLYQLILQVEINFLKLKRIDHPKHLHKWTNFIYKKIKTFSLSSPASSIIQGDSWNRSSNKSFQALNFFQNFEKLINHHYNVVKKSENWQYLFQYF